MVRLVRIPCKLINVTSKRSFYFKSSKGSNDTNNTSNVRMVARYLLFRPFVGGVGYSMCALTFNLVALSSDILTPAMVAVPVLAKVGIAFVSTSSAFTVGCGVGTFSGARSLLIDQRWLANTLPIGSVATVLSSPLTVETTQLLALTLQKAFQTPSFVPRLVRPIWRLCINQVIPLDSLVLVPELVLKGLKSNPASGLQTIVDSVLMALVAEGFDRVKSKYRLVGSSGVFVMFCGLVSISEFIWSG